MIPRYIGRFAPSPTGPLHAGSLVAALASWLDARAHSGSWLVRIEDVDTPRCLPGMDALILQQLAACGLWPDAPPAYQSQRSSRYQQALDQVVVSGWAYPCACSRKEIEIACAALGQQRARNTEVVYPGTCRTGLHGRPARAWRLRIAHPQATAQALSAPPLAGGNTSSLAEPVLRCLWNAGSPSPIEPEPLSEIKENRQSAHIPPAPVAINTIVDRVLVWHDRLLGPQRQNLAVEVGDFVLRRADGLWAYQLAVVVDDAAQGITHVVRGQDLADNTPRQIWLQQALALSTPQYLHTPLVWGANGEKLSKQNGAQALDLGSPLAALNAAAQVLGLTATHDTCGDALAAWVVEWSALYNG